jgi:hypothetical protein
MYLLCRLSEKVLSVQWDASYQEYAFPRIHFVIKLKGFQLRQWLRERASALSISTYVACLVLLVASAYSFNTPECPTLRLTS